MSRLEAGNEAQKKSPEWAGSEKMEKKGMKGKVTKKDFSLADLNAIDLSSFAPLNRPGEFKKWDKNWDTLCDELLTGPVHKDSKVKSKSAKVNAKAQVSSDISDDISDDEYDWIMENCR
jgi:hypothetical protein